MALALMAIIVSFLFWRFKRAGWLYGRALYTAPPWPDDCIFCKIVAGELPAESVQEDEHTVAFMDLNPWTRGHALVIPRRHSRNLYEVDDDDLRHAARRREAAGADGCATGCAATG